MRKALTLAAIALLLAAGIVLMTPHIKAFGCARRGGAWNGEAGTCEGLISLPHPKMRQLQPAQQVACASPETSRSDQVPNYFPAPAFRHTAEEIGRIRRTPGPVSESEADDVARFSQILFSRTLCAIGEPPLTPPPQGGVRVRIVSYPSFYPPFVVRIEHGRSATRLYTVEPPQDGSGEEPKRTERDLKEHEWRELSRLIRKDGFWQSVPLFTSTLDGTLWVIEVSEPTRYNVISRDNSRIGELVLRLAGLESPHKP